MYTVKLAPEKNVRIMNSHSFPVHRRKLTLLSILVINRLSTALMTLYFTPSYMMLIVAIK